LDELGLPGTDLHFATNSDWTRDDILRLFLYLKLDGKMFALDLETFSSIKGNDTGLFHNSLRTLYVLIGSDIESFQTHRCR
jgi:hypothetical protein